MSIDLQDQPADPAEYLPAPPRPSTQTASTTSLGQYGTSTTYSSDLASVIDFVSSRGFIFEPWQIATYVTAVRTKPFVILAGVSGTGKSALPKLIADATGASITTVPVRPDWHDSSDLLGFERLDGSFQPGHLLRMAAKAQRDPDGQYFFVLDEMNIARPEYYFAEVLSRMEQSGALAQGQSSQPLRPEASGNSPEGVPWNEVLLPANLAIVGSVNMDETTFGFSRKVLDRAFVIEFSEIDLSRVGDGDGTVVLGLPWSSRDWARAATTLAQHPERHDALVAQVVSTLEDLNQLLAGCQLQFGYRVRDEIALFCLAARTAEEAFQTDDGGAVGALDLAISMKVLPRVQGSGVSIERLLDELAKWAHPKSDDSPAFPVSGQRIDMMRARLTETGFTNYWI